MCYNVTTSLLLHASLGGTGVGKNDHLLPPSSLPPPPDCSDYNHFMTDLQPLYPIVTTLWVWGIKNDYK